MHLRRALLLFAVVVGLAALAASVSRPRDGSDRPSPPSAPKGRPEGSPRAGAEPARLRFRVGRRPVERKLAAGRRAVVTVAAREAGQVELSRLGLTSPVGPRTPAIFDLLPSEPGRVAISFIPAGGSERARVGTLIVER